MSTLETNVPPQPAATKLKQPKTYHPKEWKLVALRECPLSNQVQTCDTPEKAAAYWHQHIPSNPYFDPSATSGEPQLTLRAASPHSERVRERTSRSVTIAYVIAKRVPCPTPQIQI